MKTKALVLVGLLATLPFLGGCVNNQNQAPAAEQPAAQQPAQAEQPAEQQAPAAEQQEPAPITPEEEKIVEEVLNEVLGE